MWVEKTGCVGLESPKKRGQLSLEKITGDSVKKNSLRDSLEKMTANSKQCDHEDILL